MTIDHNTSAIKAAYSSVNLPKGEWCLKVLYHFLQRTIEFKIKFVNWWWP